MEFCVRTHPFTLAPGFSLCSVFVVRSHSLSSLSGQCLEIGALVGCEVLYLSVTCQAIFLPNLLLTLAYQVFPGSLRVAL